MTEENIEELIGMLASFRDSFSEAFNRPAQLTYSAVYLKGLMSDLRAGSDVNCRG